MGGDCIFCRIVKGELPSTRVCEEGDVLAFMDIFPVVKGHTLVVPKGHSERIGAVPAAALARVIEVVRRVAQAQFDGLGADGVNVTQANGELAGQVVPHVHFHVIPRFRNDPHSWSQPQRAYDSEGEIGTYAARIRGALR